VAVPHQGVPGQMSESIETTTVAERVLYREFKNGSD